MSAGTEQNPAAGTVADCIDEQGGNDLSQRRRVGPHGQAGGHSRFEAYVPADRLGVVGPHDGVEFDFQIEMSGGEPRRPGDRRINRGLGIRHAPTDQIPPPTGESARQQYTHRNP
ncbi:MAG TPA: hypothetical protein VIJ55_16530 [Acetobacteraceae bacterium]